MNDVYPLQHCQQRRSAYDIRRNPNHFNVLRKTSTRGVEKAVTKDSIQPETTVVIGGLERFRIYKTSHALVSSKVVYKPWFFSMPKF